MLDLLFILSGATAFYAYFGYPILLLALEKAHDSRARGAENLSPTAPGSSSFTVIITVRNEAAVIEKKLENTLLLQIPSGSPAVQIIVASDASDDQTDSIAERFADRGVLLVRSETRLGKEQAQFRALEVATGDIVVFTDAKVSLDQDALQRLDEHFRNGNVGAVSSVDRVLSDDGISSGEGLYVRYEMWLRRIESRVNSLIGMSGSCFAVRRELCANWRTDIPSDFSALLRVYAAGYIGIHADDVVCSYRAVRTEEEEFSRKVRTVLRGITTVADCSEVLNPLRYGFFSVQIWSHKIARWLVPWCLLVMGLVALIAAPFSSVYALILSLGVLFCALALIAYFLPAFRENLVLKVPLFFCVTNLAIAVATVRFLRRERNTFWDPTKKA